MGPKEEGEVSLMGKFVFMFNEEQLRDFEEDCRRK